MAGGDLDCESSKPREEWDGGGKLVGMEPMCERVRLLVDSVAATWASRLSWSELRSAARSSSLIAELLAPPNPPLVARLLP